MSARHGVTPPGVDLIGLRAMSCRWPLDEPTTRYCGADTGGMLASYCPAHRRLAYSRRAPRAGGAPGTAPAVRNGGKVPA